MESTPSYFYFIYTPRRYKLQINNFSVLTFINYGRPFSIQSCCSTCDGGKKIIFSRIPGRIEGEDLRCLKDNIIKKYGKCPSCYFMQPMSILYYDCLTLPFLPCQVSRPGTIYFF